MFEPVNDMLLDVRDLRVSFRGDEGPVTAVDGVSFDVRRGRTLGIVGESGSGKSVTTKAVMQLLPGNADIGQGSSLRFFETPDDPTELLGLKPNGKAIRQIRGGQISMIFQEPMASFSPVYTIGNQIMEAVRLHRRVGKAEAREIAIDMLDRVGLSNPAERLNQYPHELSGGMRQRAMIAAALSTRPKLLIADEPTTALDVTIQAQILELMKDLQKEFGMSIIFISHDLGVISQLADDVAVMYLGRVIERGSAADVIGNPQHPYTRALLRAIPSLDRLQHRLEPVGGDIPNPSDRPAGCAFHTRCLEFQEGSCNKQIPPQIRVSDQHLVYCHRKAG